jgi:Protein of unknown function (DUF1254)
MSNSYTRRRFGALLGVSPLALSVLSTISQPASAADDALETAINAYIYGNPLVTSEITKMATTNTVAVDMKTFQAPLGQFLSMPGYPPASYQGVTAPNADTLYSFGFFDVSKEPWVFSYPDMGDRFTDGFRPGATKVSKSEHLAQQLLDDVRRSSQRYDEYKAIIRRKCRSPKIRTCASRSLPWPSARFPACRRSAAPIRARRIVGLKGFDR